MKAAAGIFPVCHGSRVRCCGQINSAVGLSVARLCRDVSLSLGEKHEGRPTTTQLHLSLVLVSSFEFVRVSLVELDANASSFFLSHSPFVGTDTA